MILHLKHQLYRLKWLWQSFKRLTHSKADSSPCRTNREPQRCPAENSFHIFVVMLYNVQRGTGFYPKCSAATRLRTSEAQVRVWVFTAPSEPDQVQFFLNVFLKVWDKPKCFHWCGVFSPVMHVFCFLDDGRVRRDLLKQPLASVLHVTGCPAVTVCSTETRPILRGGTSVDRRRTQSVHDAVFHVSTALFTFYQ